jgi:hypothetical protein
LCLFICLFNEMSLQPLIEYLDPKRNLNKQVIYQINFLGREREKKIELISFRVRSRRRLGKNGRGKHNDLWWQGMNAESVSSFGVF